ncbi:probable LRR receptor-like serine/threonine-protein kinase At1g51820 [Chenopodium quinoa]|uniref:probable LRR receptor-like serine/threonine-protein kinase At1g51820 n=1 Tax=Chenopodium quinoa TaxID=63459 RepID=UPI000B78DAAE|nr:probable LRR receptor-like serine/threonine-protein kinase At1g51820 [Chenopodium quinoa]
MAWSLWFRRNKRVHEGLSLNASHTAAGFAKLVEDYCLYAKVFSGPPRSSKMSSPIRTCPSDDFIKVNVDAHLISSYMGLGAVAKNHRGELVWVAIRRVDSVWEVECAEAAAAHVGLFVARRLVVTRVWLEDQGHNQHEKSSKGTDDGCLKDGSKEVAVKVFSKTEAPKQFKNLVSLVGYCEEGTNLALIYEFMAMGDLKALLSEYSDSISWRKRVEIAIDTAQGLDYLHHGCSPPIVHRDVKPANILLNKEFRAKVADFGFSKIFSAEYVSNLQTRVVGTLGYLDPQYNLTGQVHEKGDVYSFGVVLLELITGKTTIVNRVMNLGQWVRSVLERGDIASILDQNLRHGTHVDDNYLTVWKAVELVVRCIQLEIADRPTMTQIVT